jgi:hypothetical protein
MDGEQYRSTLKKEKTDLALGERLFDELLGAKIDSSTPGWRFVYSLSARDRKSRMDYDPLKLEVYLLKMPGDSGRASGTRFLSFESELIQLASAPE